MDKYVNRDYVVVPGMGEPDVRKAGRALVQIENDHVRIWYANSYQEFITKELVEALKNNGR